MTIRMTFRGGGGLPQVVASVVERLAREAGLLEEEARELAESARAACERARGEASPCEIAAAFRDARVRLRIEPGSAPGEVRLDADVAPRKRRRA